MRDLVARVSDEAPTSVNSGIRSEKVRISGTCGILTTVGRPESSSEHRRSGKAMGTRATVASYGSAWLGLKQGDGAAIGLGKGEAVRCMRYL